MNLTVCDVIHGYQPFSVHDPPEWVLANLKDIFCPTSETMKSGTIPRAIQLQGWTIDAWLKCPENIKDMALKTLLNLKEAYVRGNVEVGSSGYSHPILPLLSDMLVYAEMKVDIENVRENIGEPTWFWFPEGATDSRCLEILHENYPEVTPLLPDKCLNLTGSRFSRIEYRDGSYGDAYFCNVVVKDVMMNAPVYDECSETEKNAMRNGDFFRIVMESLDPDTSCHILARDWENAESRNALVSISKTEKDVKGLLEAKNEGIYKFELLKASEPSRTLIKIEDIQPSCWEPVASRENPFPYWSPKGTNYQDLVEDKKTVVDTWLKLIKIYDETFQEIVFFKSGYRHPIDMARREKLECVDRAFEDEKFKRIFKESCPALLSCVPWHLLSRKEWSPDPPFSLYAVETIVEPGFKELVAYYAGLDESFSLKSMKKEKLSYSLLEDLKRALRRSF